MHLPNNGPFYNSEAISPRSSNSHDQANLIGLNTKELMDTFISDILITQIYNESVKEYPAMVPGYHYVNYYNYYMGMRITHNRAELEENTDHLKEGIEQVRKKNYDNRPNRRFAYVQKASFGSEPTPYSVDGGYREKGGFVHYFDSNLTIDQANQKYNTIVQDGLYDEDLLSLVCEMMFYNQNYQVGVSLTYEFLINNSGAVVVFINHGSFTKSRYSKDFYRYSQATIYFFYIIDVVFLLEFILLLIEVVYKGRLRLREI